LSTQARDPAPHYEHSEIGFNYRMSNVLAGIGRGQLQVLGERVASRRAVHRRLSRRPVGPARPRLDARAGVAGLNRWLSAW
jgi:dTDP-4-amino-4,6-dideoxygalactose transaminase